MKRDGKLVLVVDDEPGLRRLLRGSLESAGYQVLACASGGEALQKAMSAKPDLMVLDLGLPDMSGQACLSALREWSEMPVLILTVEDAEAEKVRLLDAGADDYLTKPFGVPELLARLRALERRRQPGGEDAVVRVDGLEIDLAGHRVNVDGREVRLSATEFEFLKVLARQAGKVVTQRQLLKEVWGPHAVEHSHYLRIYAAALRRKLESDPRKPRWIITEAGVGYRLGR